MRSRIARSIAGRPGSFPVAGPQEHRDLLAQRQDLEDEVGPPPDEGTEEQDNRAKDGHAVVASFPLPGGPAGRESRRVAAGGTRRAPRGAIPLADPGGIGLPVP